MINKNQSGQTLVALLFFVMIGIVAITSATLILFTNLESEQKMQDVESVRQLAELGGEKAMISILRDPNYVGETININGDTVIITVTGTTTKTIDSIATSGDFSRKIEIIATYLNNILTKTSWKVIY